MKLRTARLAPPPLTLQARVRSATPPERRMLLDRIGLVVRTLSGATAPARPAPLVQRFEELLAPADPSTVWLALSVLDGALATVDEVRRTVRAIRLDGVGHAFGVGLLSAASAWALGAVSRPEVRVLTGAVVVDVEHTARAGFATGIQRVARETVRRWDRDHEITLVGWGPEHRYLRVLDAAERRKALTGEGPVPGPRPAGARPDVVVVPWESTYVMPELSLERDRNERVAALARFARGRSGVIGFDCVPITTAETTALGVSEAFTTNLAAVRYLDTVSTISAAAAAEYGGWRTMLGSIGVEGPRISVDVLPAEVPATTEEDLAAARKRLTVPGMPMVLCVGTHEPRKNHLALLHAAELLWRQGLSFNLVLVGGRSWNDDRFRDTVAAARGRNRPVDIVTTLDDRMLWAAYRLARCLVFPSLNEGFGLPVAEALACGTPVVTSNFGSMAEIGVGGGALLVDPRDDAGIAAGLRTVLTDDAMHARLSAEAAARPERTWDDYARDVWSTLVG